MLADVIMVLIFGFYVLEDFRRGFLRLTAELVGLIIAFLLALKYYDPMAIFLFEHLKIPIMAARSLSFLVIWFLVQIVFYFVGRIVSFYTPSTIKKSSINRYLGILPAMAKALIFITILLLLFVVAPINNTLKNAISQSYLASKLINSAVVIEKQLEDVFSDNQNNLTILTNKNNNAEEQTKLNFTTTEVKIDEQAEIELLAKINQERQKNNLKPLKSDVLIRNVARAHARDMLLRGYFSHNSPDGQSIFDRLMLAHVNFQSAAENLALSPTIDLAHLGLMNSPKHRENILDSSFTRVGIGVIDAGSYGLMVTQDFAN